MSLVLLSKKRLVGGRLRYAGSSPMVCRAGAGAGATASETDVVRDLQRRMRVLEACFRLLEGTRGAPMREEAEAVAVAPGGEMSCVAQLFVLVRSLSQEVGTVGEVLREQVQDWEVASSRASAMEEFTLHTLNGWEMWRRNTDEVLSTLVTHVEVQRVALAAVKAEVASVRAVAADAEVGVSAAQTCVDHVAMDVNKEKSRLDAVLMAFMERERVLNVRVTDVKVSLLRSMMYLLLSPVACALVFLSMVAAAGVRARGA